MKAVYFFILPAILYLLFLSTPLLAQQKDFQCWPSAELSVEVIRDLKVQLEEEIRFHENCSQIRKQVNDLDISYRINKYLKADAGYRFEAMWKDPDHHVWRHGFSADVTLRTKADRFTFDYRIRLQSPKVDLTEKQKELFARGLINRHKLSVAYDVKNLPLEPFMEGEIFLPIFTGDFPGMAGYRTWIGMSYKVAKKHEFTLRYGLDKELNVRDPLTAYILALGYQYEIKQSAFDRR
jgi:hypothetical protein